MSLFLECYMSARAWYQIKIRQRHKTIVYLSSKMDHSGHACRCKRNTGCPFFYIPARAYTICYSRIRASHMGMASGGCGPGRRDFIPDTTAIGR